MDQQRNAIRSYGCTTKKWSSVFSENRNPSDPPFLATIQNIAEAPKVDGLRAFLEFGTDVPFRHIEEVMRFCNRVVSPYNEVYPRRSAWLDDREWNSKAAIAGLTPKNFYRRYNAPLTAAELCGHLKQEVRTHREAYIYSSLQACLATKTVFH
jgi:hypothetical protein